jgi:6-phosphogluconate dehydrogenase
MYTPRRDVWPDAAPLCFNGGVPADPTASLVAILDAASPNFTGRKAERDALDHGNRETAVQHARTARGLSECDGGEYTYKVAYDEAGALLEQLE